MSTPTHTITRTTSVSEAVQLTNPGWLFKRIVELYVDRKLVLLTMMHIVMTLVVYAHFGLIKYNTQITKVPLAAPFYSMKVGVPTFEFGGMHAILLQLAILPLTMSHLAISEGSQTFLKRFIPFNDLLKYHIRVGYCFMVLLLGTTLVFISFFGVLCANGEQKFCDNFTSEIMITGYVIFSLFMIVGITSYNRFRIPYKVFYLVHHLVFITYVMTLLHTIDSVERSKGGRSQTFKWFSASILFYASDRAAMYLSRRYQVACVESMAIDSGNDERLIILKTTKPDLLHFAPGQYLYLKIPKVDTKWHPFSIASAPGSDHLEFHIKVFGEKSWTGRLFEMILLDHQDQEGSTSSGFQVEVMGPYGTPLGHRSDHSHALLIGSGTGFVPCMSLLREHIDRCINLEPKQYNLQLMNYREMMRKLREEQHDRQHSWVSSLLNMNSAEKAIPNQPKAAKAAKKQMYWRTLILLLPVFGTIMLGFTLSWNQLPFELYQSMDDVLAIGTIIFQSGFFLLTVVKQEKHNMWTYIDLVFCSISVVADWFWFSKDLWGRFKSTQLTYYSLLTLYMIFRSWYATVEDISFNIVRESNSRRSGLVTFEKVRFVYIARSVASIRHEFPDLEAKWNELIQAWGLEMAREVCEISVFCTNKDRDACQELADDLQGTMLYSFEDALTFGRPSTEQIIGDNTKSIIASASESSNTLFAFCGSKQVGRTVKHAKIHNDLFLSMMGHQNDHKVNLIVQSYGNLVSPKPQNISKQPKDDFEKIVPSSRADHIYSNTGFHETSFRVEPADLRESISRTSITDRSFLRKSGTFSISSQRSRNGETKKFSIRDLVVDCDESWEGESSASYGSA